MVRLPATGVKFGERGYDCFGFGDGAASDLIPYFPINEILKENDKFVGLLVKFTEVAGGCLNIDVFSNFLVEVNLAAIHVVTFCALAVDLRGGGELGDERIWFVWRGIQHNPHDPRHNPGAFTEKDHLETIYGIAECYS